MEVNHDCVVQSTMYNMYRKWKVPRTFKYADGGRWDLIPARLRRCPREARFRHAYAPSDTALHRLVRPLRTSNAKTSTATKTTTTREKGRDRKSRPQRDDSALSDTDVASETTSAESAAFVTAGTGRAEARREEINLFQGKGRSFDDEDEDGKNSKLVLKMQIDAIRAIVHHYPAATTVRDMFGRKPLHLACMMEDRAMRGATDCPLSHDETGENDHGDDRDEDLDSPRRDFAAKNRDRSLVAEFLVCHTPMAATAQDEEGRTPLHNLLLSYCRDSDDDGREDDFPNDGCGHTDFFPWTLLGCLLRADPDATSRLDRQGRSPIHVAEQIRDEEIRYQQRRQRRRENKPPVDFPSIGTRIVGILVHHQRQHQLQRRV